MKHIFAIALLLCLVSCQDGNDFGPGFVPSLEENTNGGGDIPTEVTLSVSPSTLLFEAAGGSREITVTCNTDWTVSSNAPSWCNVAKGNGKVTVTAAENTSIEKRTATVTVTAGTEKREVTITQTGADITISISPSTLSFTAAGGSKDVTITCNTDWTVTSDSPSWCNVAKGDGKVTVTASENTSTEQRTATVTLTITGVTETTITVTQTGADITLSVSPSTLSFAAAGGSKDVTVTSNTDWTVSSNAPSWCTVAKGNGKVAVTAAENTTTEQRSATVTVTAGTEKREVTITQAGADITLSVSPSTLSFEAVGGSKEVTVTSNTDWVVTSDATSWCTITKGNGKVLVTAIENTTMEQRSSTVTVTAGTEKRMVAVTQAKPTTGTENSHEWVDLGLSVRWATMNVGASSPEDDGDYFAWGETEPKDDYSWSTYKWCKGSSYSMTKYCTSSSYGTVDNRTVLECSDDAASVKWRGNWRMPTYDELNELNSKCTWTWTTLNGHNGYHVKGPNGNSIFLPAAGYRYGTSLGYVGSNGGYWSSSLNAAHPNGARILYFSSSGRSMDDYFRYYGQSVRPVSEP